MELKEKLLSVAEKSDLGCRSFLLLEEGSGHHLEPLDLEEKDGEHIANLFALHLRELANKIESNLVLPITAADGRAGGIYKYNLPNMPPRLNLGLEALAMEDLLSYSRPASSIVDAKAFVSVLGRNTERICLYKHLYPVSVFRKKNLFEVVTSAGAAPTRLKQAANELLRVDGSFDFFFIDDSMYSIGTKIIEKYYGFSDAILAEATKCANSIAATDLVADVNKITRKIETGDASFAKKIVRAVSTSRVLGLVSRDKIIAYTKTNKYYTGKFHYSPSGDAIELTSMASVHTFLKLICDDCLYSELTDTFYDVSVKDPA